MADNKIVITSEGLLKDSRKLIENKTYDSSKITVIGSPFIVNGVASSFSETSYLTHDVDFSNAEKVRVKTVGTYATPTSVPLALNEGEILWCLTNSDSKKLYLQVLTGSIAVLYKSNKIIEIEDISYSTGETINVSVELTSTTYKIIIVKDEEYKIFEGALNNIDINSWSTFLVGSEGVNSSYYWQGSINLADLEIYKGNSLYYTPSTSPVFNFTKILTSDGTIALTNDSIPIIKHVYELPISDIQRTGNTLLISSVINKNVSANIAEIGLYSVTDEGTLLYATVDGLSIKKSSDLEYSLIFYVDLQLSVVNTTIHPEIVIETGNSIKKNDFWKVQRTYVYSIENLERASLLDSTSLIPNTAVGAGSAVKRQMGYDRAQNVLNLEAKLEENQGACRSCEVYNSIRNKIADYSYRVYDGESLSITGSPTISNDGVLTDITTEDYVITQPFEMVKDFEVLVPFENLNPFTGSQEIMSFYSTSMGYTPLSLYLDSTRACNLTVYKPDKFRVTNYFYTSAEDFYRNPASDTVIDFSNLMSAEPSSTGDNVYSWESNEALGWTNCHATLVGSLNLADNWVFSGFSQSNYLTTPGSEKFEWTRSGHIIEFSIISGFTVTSLTSKQCILSGKEGNYYIELSLNTSGNLEYRFGNGESWTVTRTGIHVLEVNKTYMVQIMKNNTEIICNYSEDNGTNWINDLGDGASITGVIPTNCGLQFGISADSNNRNPFLGSLNAGSFSVETWYTEQEEESMERHVYLQTWYGAESVDNLFSKQPSLPTTSTILYDSDGFKLWDYTISNIEANSELFSQSLFSVSPNTKYYVKVKCENGMYSFSYYTDDSDEIFISLPVHSSSYLESISGISFGVLIGPGTSVATLPFNGKIYFKDMDLIINSTNVSPNSTINVVKHLNDFYSFMNVDKSFYYVNNLSGLQNSRIRYVEGDIKGNKDEISFASQNGSSLSVKVGLEDTKAKMLLSKVKVSSTGEVEKYFILEQTSNFELKFTLFYADSMIELIKQYSSESIGEILVDEILVTIVHNYGSGTLKMYVNNTLVAEISATVSELTASDYELRNASENASGELEVAEYNYVKGIMSFEGVLQTDDIFLLTNLTDTNY